MITTKISNYLFRLRAMQKIGVAFSRAAATAPLRTIDPTRPSTWEFSGFSQNGEDGITDYLVRRICSPNRRFIEIGAADGIENLTAWLALGCRYSGIMIDGNPRQARQARLIYPAMNLGVDFRCQFVDTTNVKNVAPDIADKYPDLFSLDIDGVDYYVARTMLEDGFRPRIFVVEYNSAFGPDRRATVQYSDTFNQKAFHHSGLYYGVSVNGWKTLLTAYGYHFVTVDQNGVNAFFIHADSFPAAFTERLQGIAFAENFNQRAKHGTGWEAQFEKIRTLPLVEIK